MRKFIEREDFHDRNRWIASSIKYGCAELSDGRDGIMLVIDRNITVMSIDEAKTFVGKILDQLEIATSDQAA